MKHSEAFEKLCEDARSRVREITVEDVKRKLDAGEKFRFIDVREDREWELDHAAGAEHLGRGIIERDIEKTAPDKDAEIVLYCGGRLSFGSRGGQSAKDGLHERPVNGRRDQSMA